MLEFMERCSCHSSLRRNHFFKHF